MRCLSEIEKAKIIDIYNRTNFGCDYIAKMFDVSKYAIRDFLRKEKIQFGKIKQEDVTVAEEILCNKLPFKISIKGVKDVIDVIDVIGVRSAD